MRSLLTISVLALLSACDQPAPVEVLTPVRVVAARALADNIELGYSAQVTPETQVDVAFRTDGYIALIRRVPGLGSTDRFLQAGDKVAQGDVLARIQDEQYRDKVVKAQAYLDKARAALRKAELDYQRATALNETRSITGPDYDAARKEYETTLAGVDGAQAQLDEANIKLSDTALLAPMNGTILQRQIEIGTLVHSGSVGFVLANTNSVKVVFGIPDVVLKDFQLGSRLNIRTASLPKTVFPGVVTEIAPAADKRTRVFEVSLIVQNPDGALRAGMVASLDVDASMMPREVTVVPINAIVRSADGGFGLFVVEQGDDGAVARLRSVQTGQVLGNLITITSGVSIGDQVIVTGTAQVSDMQPVKVVP
jgi:RND family efflux transporter MFP subunit